MPALRQRRHSSLGHGAVTRYRCAACRKTFNPLTGTPLSGLHYPDRWQDQAQALINGETIAKAAARRGVDYTPLFAGDTGF